MRFSAASFLAIVSMMMAPLSFVLAEEETVATAADAADAVDAAVDATVAPVVRTAHTPAVLEVGNDDSQYLYTVPVVFNFEFDGTVSDDTRSLSHIEEALVMAGNEIFDPEYTKFFGLLVNGIVREHIEEEEDDDDDPDNLHQEETPAIAPAETPTVLIKAGTRGGAAAEAAVSDPDNLTFCVYTLFNCRPTPRPTPRPTRRPTPRPTPVPPSQYRLDYDITMPYFCTFCSDGSEPSYRHRNGPRSEILHEQEENQRQGKQALTIPQKPLMAADEEKEQILRWQKRTCRKIRKIKGFETAKKCFIHLDVGHSTPIDAFGNDKPYLSKFWLKDEVEPEDDLTLEALPLTVTK